MGRSSEFKVDDFFEVSDDKSTSTCKVSECKKVFKGCVLGNLKRHIVSVHKVSVSKEKLSSVAKTQIVKIKMSKSHLTHACVEMITRDALPYRCMDSPGFRKIIDPICSALGISINSSNIKSRITEAAAQIKSLISNELHQRMFSLKIDTATRLGRSILGVNAQFISNGNVEVRILAMLEMNDRHTAENLKKEIERILTRYDCTLQQVVSITTDNGANMVKCVALLENAQGEEITIDDEVIEEDDLQREENGDDAEMIVMNSLEDYTVVQGTLKCVRCASHTLQVRKNIITI